ncbi:MAG: diguanylate cyclase domain-containing protein, partial [Desulfovibrionales bacterium]
TVARVGGDEFVLILPEVDSRESALAIAEKIQTSLEKPVDIGGKTLSITVSIGIAFCTRLEKDEELLFRAADDAMYKAKELNRRNRKSNIILTDIDRLPDSLS